MFGQDKEIVAMAIAGMGLILFLVTIFILSVVRYRKRVEKESEEKIAMTKQFEKALLQSKLETQEETFRQIATELHDNVGQLLSTTKMLMAVAEMHLITVPDTLLTANATLSKAIQELRFLSRSLDKEWLEQFDFQENLQAEVDRINSGKTIEACIHTTTAMLLKPDEQLILFRIVQEAIQNAVRHAGPTRLDIMLKSKAEVLEVVVANNGKPLPENFSGMGTNNMKHRVKLLGGTVFWTAVQEGTIVTVQLPCKAEI